jgi:hypothetical protein
MAEATVKPTFDKPISDLSKGYQKNFDRALTQQGINKLNEVDGYLSEAEQSLKKKIFSLAKMEALVFSDPKLSAVYEEMSVNGEEKYGYHYNETIMNMLFNDYVLDSPKYLQKYKQAIPKEKKRRDKSGINQLKKSGEKNMTSNNFKPQKLAPTGLKPVDESDEPITKVQFLVNEKDPENPDVFAYFPEEIHNGEFRTAYSHIGQHSACHPDYAKESRPATPEESQPLQAELEGLGYNLEVLNPANEMSGTGGGAGGMGSAFGGGSGQYTQALGNKNIDETTTSASSGAYVGPAVWGSGDLMKVKGKSKVKKIPMVKGGTFIQESKNYLVESEGFEKFFNLLNEQQENKGSVDDLIIDKTNAFTSNTVKGWNGKDTNTELNMVKTGQPDKANLNTVEESKLEEKSVSKKQQKFMGMVHAVQKGELSPDKVGGDVADTAKSMKPKDAEDFASTKHKGLPEKVKPKKLNEFLSLHDTVEYLSDRSGEEPFMQNGIKWQFVNAKYPDGKTDIGVYRFGHDLVYDYKRWNEEMGINENNIKEDTLTMIADKQDSMSNKAVATGGQSSGVPMGMNTTGGGINESHEKLLEEINNELKAFSIHQDKLKKMTEDRKPSALVLKDRLGNENKANFKKDLKDSSVSKLVDIENELEYANQQTEVKDPYELGEKLEKGEIKATDAKSGEALKNVGDSANDAGDEIPKRNLSKEEQDEVNLYRLGLGDYVYDNEVGKRFEDRMKADMGDKLYKQRQDKLAFRGKAPMYNKDPQPIDQTTADKVQFDKEQSGWNEREGLKEGIVTGKYFNFLGKKKIIDFNLNEVWELKTAEPTEYLCEVNFDGLGNTYTQKVSVNENVVKAISGKNFFTNGVEVFVLKAPVQNLNENEQKGQKPVINEQINKMKHLVGYNTATFIKQNKI